MKKYVLLLVFAFVLCIGVSAVGDFNNDGRFSSRDFLEILDCVTANNDDVKYDINGDGSVTLADALTLVKYKLEGKRPSLCSLNGFYHDGCVCNFISLGEYSTITYTCEKYDIKVSFKIYVPETYTPDKEYALAVHLHGLGGESKATSSLSGGTYFDNILASKYGDETILLLPQCPVGMTWPNDRDTVRAAYELIEYLCDHMSIDENRLYLSGHSNGSKGVAYMIMENPDTFAAAIMCAGASSMDNYDVSSLVTTPIWLFCSDDDPMSGFLGNVRALYKVLGAFGGDVKYTEYSGLGHNIFGTVGNERGLVDWVFTKTLAE